MSRREMLALGAALGLGVGRVLPAQGSLASRRLRLCYRTDPRRIARMTPPPLELASDPLVEVEFEFVEVAESARSILTPGSYGRLSVFVAVRLGDETGWLPAGLWTSNERARLAARELLGLGVRDGRITLDLDGETLSASFERRGRTLLEVETALADVEAETAEARTLFFPVMKLRPDWPQGALEDGPVELRRLTRESPAGEACGCDLSRTELRFPEASALDPLAEFPVVELISARYEADARPAAFSAPQPAAEIPAEDFAPWTLFRHDRPISKGKVWTPAGWRREATAYKLTEEEGERYRARKEIVLDPFEMVSLEAMIEPRVYASLLPPPCRPIGRPAIKALGLRVRRSDLSIEPFQELWLFVFCLVANRPAWYALAHIVGPGGDVIYGREAFGYPSKQGAAQVVVTPVSFSLSGRRLGREFLYADGMFRGFATGVTLDRLPVVCLQAAPGKARRGRLVFQMWHMQGRRYRVDPRTLRLELPAAGPERGGPRSDPWFELAPADIYSATAMDGAVMQRSPGEIVGEVEDFEPYYRERCDGVLPWAPDPPEAPRPTFLPSGGTERRT